MIACPIDTSIYIGKAMYDSFVRDVINGDLESRSHWFTYAAGSIFGFKGLGNVGKAGAQAAKTGAQKAGQRLDELLPYHPKHQLAIDGPVPYNVYDGNFFKDQLMMKFSNHSTAKNKPLHNLTKKQLATKPKHSPVPDKWIKKGGEIKVNDEGVWTYTNKKGQSVSYPNGFPDFSKYVHPKIKTVTIQMNKPKNHQIDNRKANKKAGLGKNTDPAVVKSDRPPKGYTWHHHQDGKTMILVKQEVHAQFTHVGGASMVQ